MATAPETHYSFNGVNFARASANPFQAFIRRSGTSALAGITNVITKVEVPGRHGYIPAPSRRTEQTLVFSVAVPRDRLEALLAFLGHTGRNPAFPHLGELAVSVAPGKAAYYELVSAIPGGDFPNDWRVHLTVTINLPEGAWRDISTTTETRAITLNPQTITIAAGISLPITDADIFIAGNVGTMQITDMGSGAWLRTTGAYTHVTGQGLYFQGATGRAFRASTTSPWTPIQDLGFAVDTSGNGFAMTPTLNPALPLARVAELQIISLNLSGVSVQARYRGAYVMK